MLVQDHAVECSRTGIPCISLTRIIYIIFFVCEWRVLVYSGLFLKLVRLQKRLKNCYALTSLSLYGVVEGQKNCSFEVLFFGEF